MKFARNLPQIVLQIHEYQNQTGWFWQKWIPWERLDSFQCLSFQRSGCRWWRWTWFNLKDNSEQILWSQRDNICMWLWPIAKTLVTPFRYIHLLELGYLLVISDFDFGLCFFFFSLAAAFSSVLNILAAFMSFGAVVRSCFICVAIKEGAGLESQEAESVGTGSNSDFSLTSSRNPI